MTYIGGVPQGILHGAFKPVDDCTLHVIGVRATMQLEGLTRGFDTSASDAMASVIAASAMVPPASVQFINVRTVRGFASYYVSDCRSTNCPGAPTSGRRRLQAPAPSGATALEIEFSISSNDNALRNVLNLFEDLRQEDQQMADHFAQLLSIELSAAYSEPTSVAVRALNITTAETVYDTSQFSFPSAELRGSPPPASSAQDVSLGPLIGAAVGGTLAALVVVGALSLHLRRRHHRKPDEKPCSVSAVMPSPPSPSSPSPSPSPPLPPGAGRQTV